jgi:hypothetical protein
MKTFLRFLGTMLIICGVIFLFIHSMIVTGISSESFARDLFGFPIPHPPLWTSYIPYLGGLLGFIFEFFSLHGLVGIIISGVLFYIGALFIGFGNKRGKG